MAKSERRNKSFLETLRKNRFVESFIDFWKIYSRYKSGVAGLIILLFFIFLAAFGQYLAEPNQSLFSGTHQPLAAPQWAGIFDPNYFPDQYLVDADFVSSQEISHYNISATANGSLSIGYQWIDEKDVPSKPGVLAVKVSDDLEKPGNGSFASFSIKFEFKWNYNKPPNTVDFYFYSKGAGEGAPAAMFLSSPSYKIRWKVYIWIKGYNRSQMIEYLEKNAILTPYDYDDYGVFFTSTLGDKTVSAAWQKSKHRMRDDIKNALFKKGMDLIVEIRFTFSVLSEDMRTAGTFCWYIDLVKVIGTSYYYGLMGTTDTGADLWSLIVDGAKVSLMIGFIVAAVQITIGTLVGVVAGYYGGRVDEVLMRIVDFFMSIPGLPLLIVLTFIFVQMNMSKVLAIIIALVIFGWIGPTRVIRSQVLVEREKPYIEAAKAAGASDAQIIWRHIIPAVMPLVLIYMIFGVTGAIIAEAALSFLGLGPDWNSWGRILQRASVGSLQAGGRAGYGLTAWWYIFFPGFMLSLLGLAFMFIGFALERVYNPRAAY